MIKKIIYITTLVIFILLQMISNSTKVKALEINNTTYLQRADKGFLSIQKWNGKSWMYVVHSITNFVDENGVSRVAYCVNPDLNGIGYIDGEFEGYDVQIKNYIEDQRLWRVYTNGYPYKTPTELGVENNDDAYLATKQAAYCIIRGYSIEEVRNLYRAGQDYVEGESLEDIQRRGQKIIDAMCKMVDIGYNGTSTMKFNNLLKIEPVGEISLDVNNDYYSQNYKVTCEVDFDEFTIQNIEGFPIESYVADINGNKKNVFNKNEIFKVMIPKKEIIDNCAGTVTISAKCKNYPIFYAESTNGNYQNYILCADSYSNKVTASVTTNIDAYKSKLQIFKVDKDTKKALQGVKFLAKYKDGNEIGVYTTDESGKIYIDKLKKGEIIVTELENNKDYVVNNDPIEINIKYDELKTVTVENELKKGSIKIIKVDADDNTIRIPNVKFEIYNENKELISTVKTDVNGEAQLNNLPINTKYTIKEIETADEYELQDKDVTVKLEENEIKTLTFKNNKKHREALPRTGMPDWTKYLVWFIFGAAVSLFIYTLIVFSSKL